MLAYTAGCLVLLSGGTGPRIEIVIPLALRSVELNCQSVGRLFAVGIAVQAAVRQAVRSPPNKRPKTTKPTAAAARTRAVTASHGAAPANELPPGRASTSPNVD